MTIVKFAFDKSARRTDADGRLHVARSHISKAAVNPYYGSEIPGFEALGLDAQTVYRLLRDPVELERAAPTFARLPVLSKHVPVTVDAPQPDLIVGAIGSDVVFNLPYLDADFSVWDATALAGIETKKVHELSCAYRNVPVMEPGEYEGQPYDGRMTEIQGNHLALVEVGRAGADVVVADSNPFPKKFKEQTMKMTKLGKALFASLCAASPVFAVDSALPALVGQAEKKTFKRADVAAKLLAMDASIDSNKLDNIIDAILDVEQEPQAVEPMKPAADESPADKVKAMLAGKVDDAVIEQIVAMLAAPAADEFPEKKDEEKPKDEGMKKEDVKAAMDAAVAGVRKTLLEAQQACHDVRPTVGDVMGMDSAADVYGFALDHLKVDRVGVTDATALRALYRAATRAQPDPGQRMAQDSVSALQKFPGLARFRSV